MAVPTNVQVARIKRHKASTFLSGSPRALPAASQFELLLPACHHYGNVASDYSRTAKDGKDTSITTSQEAPNSDGHCPHHRRRVV